MIICLVGHWHKANKMLQGQWIDCRQILFVKFNWNALKFRYKLTSLQKNHKKSLKLDWKERCWARADSASCDNFLFCEDKIANEHSDDYAKGHKSPIFQEVKRRRKDNLRK